MTLKKVKDRNEQKKLIKELIVITIGTIVGVVTYVVCLITKFAIFGWNFGLVLAPLFAGYVESQIAKKYLEESTGAVSAFILFIITVVYGFIIANPTLGFNIITAGSILIIIQSAMPIATNYFLVGTLLAFVSHISGIFKKISRFFYDSYLKFMKQLKREPRLTIEEYVDNKYNIYSIEHDMNDLGVLLLTSDHAPYGKTILGSKGIFESREIFSFKQRDEFKALTEKEVQLNFLGNIKMAEDKALLKIIKDLKKHECNCILNLNMIIETVGVEKGEHLMQVVYRGTGVILEEEDEIGL